jgi:hypothetical protein
MVWTYGNNYGKAHRCARAAADVASLKRQERRQGMSMFIT